MADVVVVVVVVDDAIGEVWSVDDGCVGDTECTSFEDPPLTWVVTGLISVFLFSDPAVAEAEAAVVLVDESSEAAALSVVLTSVSCLESSA